VAPLANYAVKAGVVCLQVKLRDPHLSALEVRFSRRDVIQIYVYLYLTIPTVTQNSPFFPSGGWTIASAHCATDGWPGWVDLGGLVIYEDGRPPTVSYPNTNRAWRTATTLITANALLLSQPATEGFWNLKIPLWTLTTPFLRHFFHPWDETCQGLSLYQIWNFLGSPIPKIRRRSGCARGCAQTNAWTVDLRRFYPTQNQNQNVNV